MKKWNHVADAVRVAYALACLTDYLLQRAKTKVVAVRHRTLYDRIPKYSNFGHMIGPQLFNRIVRPKNVRRSRYGSVLVFRKNDVTIKRIKEAKEVLRKLLLLLVSAPS